MLPAAPLLHQRSLWLHSAATTTTKLPPECTPFTLPSLGVISINPTYTITLDADARFTPDCNPDTISTLHSTVGIQDVREPFHASVAPQVYATAAATVISWMLVITLLITPRTFFVGGTEGISFLRGSRGMIGGATGGASVIGVGSRPWLQKVAALTVAISLTIATADTFMVAEEQYHAGIMDASQIREHVVGGLEVKISRIISDIFLWLAQVQTLIRLFPRHKEKVIIKWVGFALIVLDMTFNCLNSFMIREDTRSRRFTDAIPALSYLFQLALSMLYAAWVVYYSITKRRYAYYHSMMWNITLIAFLSLIAILTPVVFFITDIANWTVAGWGDYFRWVGAAAASVIVWEWVERIEALEREEKKDGILGREIYDGDEMLDFTRSTGVKWSEDHKYDFNNGGGSGGSDGGGGVEAGIRDAFSSGRRGQVMNGMARRLARIIPSQPNNTAVIPLGRIHSQTVDGSTASITQSRQYTSTIPTPPPPVASPVSRTDTTSAASTVYAVRYHPINEPFVPVARQLLTDSQKPGSQAPHPLHEFSLAFAEPVQRQEDGLVEEQPKQPLSFNDPEGQVSVNRRFPAWQAVSNPFKRKRSSPPPEVLGGKVIEPFGTSTTHRKQTPNSYSRWDVRGRFASFAADQSDKFRERVNGRQVEVDLPVTIIPAQPRGRTWSPDVLHTQAMQTSFFEEATHWSASPTVEVDRQKRVDNGDRAIQDGGGIANASTGDITRPRPEIGNNQTEGGAGDHNITRDESVQNLPLSVPPQPGTKSSSLAVPPLDRARSPISPIDLGDNFSRSFGNDRNNHSSIPPA